MMLIFFGCLVATAMAISPIALRQLAQQQPQYQQSQYQQPQYQQPQYQKQSFVPIVSESNEINPDGSFSYGYVSGDGSQAQAQGYLKNAGQKDNEAEVLQGSYSYTSPEGIPITVTWSADENGFRAEGAHLPTPPPIPAEIQRSLDIIARQPAQPQSQYSSPNQYRQSTFGGQSRFPAQNTYSSQGRYRF